MAFYTGKQFPLEYRNSIFIAEHGSWNRSTKAGYRVIAVKLNGNRVESVEPFVTGWLNHQKQTSWGRPVDIINLPDGSILISDDHAGAVYRVNYQLPPD
jgi:glucose/arabinose dehydrogenase